MANSTKKYSLYKGYNFIVEIDCFKEPLSFTKVSSMERGIETESCSIGGLNSRVYSLANAVGSERTMTFERGVMSAEDQEAFMEISDYFLCDIAIAVVDDNGQVLRYYYLTECSLKSIRLGDFDASQSNILVETLEFVYNEIQIITSI